MQGELARLPFVPFAASSALGAYLPPKRSAAFPPSLPSGVYIKAHPLEFLFFLTECTSLCHQVRIFSEREAFAEDRRNVPGYVTVC